MRHERLTISIHPWRCSAAPGRLDTLGNRNITTAQVMQGEGDAGRISDLLNLMARLDQIPGLSTSGK
ncbi:MAG: hypothetical protein ABI865_05945, partial [Nitrosospira sp.]